MDTSERNQALVEENGRIWDEGFLCFDNDMKDGDEVVELLNVRNTSLKQTIKVLQLYLE